VSTLGYRSHLGRIFCASPRCEMPTEERKYRFDFLDERDAALRCVVCGFALADSLKLRTSANEQGAKVPMMDSLSVRACHALRRYYERRNQSPELAQRAHTELAEVDLRELRNMGDVGPKTIAEIRNAALAAGVDLVNATEITGVPAATGPWEIREIRVQGPHILVTLHCAGANLKLLRSKAEAAQLLVGSEVQITLTPAVEKAPEPSAHDTKPLTESPTS